MAMKTKKAKKVDVKAGDKVYLWKSASFVNREEKRELTEAHVMEVNTASIHVQLGTQRLRFDKRTLKCRDGVGGSMQLFVDPNEFYEAWDKKQETIRLRREVQELNDSASLETLKQVHALYVEASKQFKTQ